VRKVAILTLGLHPRALELVITRKKPKVCHVVAGDDGLKYVAKEQGYNVPNSEVLKAAAKRAKSKLIIYKCDPFDPESIGDAVGQILENLKPDEQVMINYSGGTQAMSLVLGSVALVLTRVMPIQILYSTKTIKGEEKIYDHSDVLKELFHKLYEIVPGIMR